MSAIDDDIKDLLEGLNMQSIIKDSSAPKEKPPLPKYQEPNNNPSTNPPQPTLPPTSSSHQAKWAAGAAVIFLSGLLVWAFYPSAAKGQYRLEKLEPYSNSTFFKLNPLSSNTVAIDNVRLIADEEPNSESVNLPSEAQGALAQFSVNLQELLENRKNLLEQRKLDVDHALLIDAALNPDIVDSAIKRYQAADIFSACRIARFIQDSSSRLQGEYGISREVISQELLRVKADAFPPSLLQEMDQLNDKMTELKQSIERVRTASSLPQIADAVMQAQTQIRALDQTVAYSCLIDFDRQRVQLQRASQEALSNSFNDQAIAQRLPAPEEERALIALSTFLPPSSIQPWQEWIDSSKQQSRPKRLQVDRFNPPFFFSNPHEISYIQLVELDNKGFDDV